MKKAVVIGCGKFVAGQQGWAIGHAHGSGYINSGVPVELYAVDVLPENLTSFGRKFDVPDERLFESTESLYRSVIPDVVSICTWPELHAPMALEAMEQGVKSIIIEKPIATDRHQLDLICQKAKEHGVFVSVGHQRRHEAVYQEMRQVVKEKRLGEVVQVVGHVGDGWDILSWTSHWFDFANFLFDRAPAYVLAGMDVTDKRIYQHACENESIIYASYFEGNSAVFLTGPSDGFSIRLLGSKGVAQQVGDRLILCTDEGVETIPLPVRSSPFNSLCAEAMNVLDGGPEPLCSIGRCSAATEMAYAAQESARTQRKVQLPLQTGFAPLEVIQHPEKSVLYGKRTLLYADSHFESGGREGIADTLVDLTGMKPVVIDAEQSDLMSSNVDDVDYILIYHTQKLASEETRSCLREWVLQGKALVIVHAGLGAWPEWDEYLEWCGLVWEWGKSEHPYCATELNAETESLKSLGFSQAWLPRDEVFTKLKSISPVELMLSATISSGETYPAAWRNKNVPNVATWVPGHRRDLWTLPAMRKGIESIMLTLSSDLMSLAGAK